MPITHYVRWDEPGWKSRLTRAVCGRLVNPLREHSNAPTCETCAAWLDGYEKLDIGADSQVSSHD